MQRESRQQPARPQSGRVMPNSYQQPPIPVNRPPAAQGQIRVQPPIQQPPRQILSASQRMRAIKVSAATGQRQLPPMPRQSPYPIMPQPNALPQRKSKGKSKSTGKNFLLILGLILVGMFSFVCMSITVGMMVIYGNGILPGVQAAGVNLGGMSQQEAEIALRNEWTAITLRDGDREFASVPGALGIQLDAAQTAQMAFEQGRGSGNVFGALVKTEISPIVIVDMGALIAGLEALAPQVEIPAVNAGVALVNGQVQATLPITGRTLDINATATRIQNDEALASGTLDLIMINVQPTVTDSSAMVQAAQQLLTNP
ncbi:MAG: peptidoglycan binding domain-containing protein, partial [Chitinophagaceae bacterium]|nr:peptidoglycan binding domain-containing protein [Anaerolineae bacterium]